jgi:hypothetical protein
MVLVYNSLIQFGAKVVVLDIRQENVDRKVEELIEMGGEV